MRYVTCLSLPLLCLLAACSDIPREAFYSRGSPEGLMDVSAEVVSFQIADSSAVAQVIEWINADQPSTADLRCSEESTACVQVQEVLAQFAVPYEYNNSSENSLTLMYERVVTRDCDNRFVSNHINPYNLNHPAFGCSTAANMAQMISDQRQITNPSLMGYMDGNKAYQIEKAYSTKPQVATDSANFEDALSID